MNVTTKAANMSGQHYRQDKHLTAQSSNQAGHCPLTSRYFEPCRHGNQICVLVLQIMPKKTHAAVYCPNAACSS